MKVLHVLTFVGPGNPFGGPARVSANQATELRRRGNVVVVVAAQPPLASRGSWAADDVLAFDSRTIFRRAGFAGIVSVGLYRYLWRHVRDYDVVHVHMSRDLVTMPAAIIARIRKVPYVLQTHGMIDASHRRSARVLDAIATRSIVGGAARVFVLTDREMHDITSLMGNKRFAGEVLQNGINIDSDGAPPPSIRGIPEVLFCARLHPRKRPRAFVQAAMDLLSENVKATFVLVGPDEGELAPVEAMLPIADRTDDISIEPPLEPHQVSDRLGRCSFLVLPSVDEPFPMIVLEALAAGRAVVITESCGLADFVRTHSCGVVVPADDQQSLTRAMRDLISSPDMASEMGARGRTAIRNHLSIERVVDQLSEVYRRSAATTQ